MTKRKNHIYLYIIGIICVIAMSLGLFMGCASYERSAQNNALGGGGTSTSEANSPLSEGVASTFYNWTAVKNYVQGLKSGDNVTIIIGANMTATETIVVPSGATVVFRSASGLTTDIKTIKRAGKTANFHDIFINVSDEAKVYFKDVVLDGYGARDVLAVGAEEHFGCCNSLVCAKTGAYVEILAGATMQYNHLNKANGGASVCLEAGSNMIMRGGYLGHNRFSHWYNDGEKSRNSGAVYVGAEAGGANPAIFTMENGTIDDNTKSFSGSAVYVVGKFIMNNGVISNSEAYSAAALMMVENATIILNDGEIFNNVAVKGAGVCYIYKSTLIINGGKYHDNSTSSWGAGVVSIESPNGTGSVLEINGGEFYENTGSQIGGVVYASRDCGTINIKNAKMYNNKVLLSSNNGSGGAIGNTATAGAMNISNCEIYNNTAPQSGGGIYISAINVSFELDGSAVYGNKAVKSGAGIYCAGVPKIKGNVRVYDNKLGDIVQNLVLNAATALKVTGPLDNAKIYVSKEGNTGVVAEGVGYTLTPNDVMSFYSDAGENFTFKVENNKISMQPRADHITHNYKAIEREPSCVEQGYSTEVCIECHEVKKDGKNMPIITYIPPKGHIFKWIGTGFRCTETFKQPSGEVVVCNEECTLKVEGYNPSYKYIGKEIKPTPKLQVIDKDGQSYLTLTEALLGITYSPDLINVGAKSIQYAFTEAKTRKQHIYKYTHPIEGTEAGTVDYFNRFVGSYTINYKIDKVDTTVKLTLPTVPRDGRTNAKWYTNDTNFFSGVTFVATANSGATVVDGKLLWYNGSTYGVEFPKLLEGSNIYKWKFTPTFVDNLTEVTGEFAVADVVKFGLASVDIGIKKFGAIYNNTKWDTVKDMFTVTANYNRRAEDSRVLTKSEFEMRLYDPIAKRTYDTIRAGDFYFEAVYSEEGITKVARHGTLINIAKASIDTISAVVKPNEKIFNTTTLEDLRGMITVSGIYTGDSISEEIFGYTLTGDLSTTGKKTIRVEFSGKFADLKVEVLPNKLVSITVDWSQTKEFYTSGNLNTLGDYGNIKVTAKYSDNSTKLLNFDQMGKDGYAISGDTSIAGSININISYSDKDINGDISTVGATIQLGVAEVVSKGIRFELKEGEFFFKSDVKNGEVHKKLNVYLVYNDGSEEIVVGEALLSDTGVLRVFYEDYTKRETIVFTETETVSIEVAYNTGGKKIFVVDTVDKIKEYLTVTQTFNDNQKSVVTNFSVSIPSSQNGKFKQGNNIVTVAYTDAKNNVFTKTVTIFVDAITLDSITVGVKDGVFNDNGTIAGGYIFTSSMLAKIKDYITVIGNYNDGTQKTISVYAYNVSGSLEAGQNEFTVIYTNDETHTDLTANLTVMVTAVQLINITATFDQRAFVIYANTDVEKLIPYVMVVAHFNDGSIIEYKNGFSLSITSNGGVFVESGTNNVTATLTSGGNTFTTEFSNLTITAKQFSRLEAEVVQNSAPIYASATWAVVADYVKIYAVYNDGSREKLVFSESAGVSGKFYSMTGNLKVSGAIAAYYSDGAYSTTFNIMVTPVVTSAINSIDTSKIPSPLYSNIDFNILKSFIIVYATFNDGSAERQLKPEEFILTGTLVGGQTCALTVTSGSRSKTFDVAVASATITGIASVTVDQSTSVIFPSADIQTLKDYITVTATLSDSTTKVLQKYEYTLTGDIISNTFVVAVSSFTKEFKDKFVITPIKAGSISVEFDIGDAMIYEGASVESLAKFFTVTAVMNDGSTKIVPYGLGGYIIDGSLSCNGGAQTVCVVTLSYAFGGDTVTVTQNVMVYPVEYQSAKALLSNLPIIYNADALLDGIFSADQLKLFLNGMLNVSLVYNNGTTVENWTNYTLSIGLQDWLLGGDIDVTVSVGGIEKEMTTTFVLNVVVIAVEKIEVEDKADVVVYSSWNLPKIKDAISVSLINNNGTKNAELLASEYSIRLIAGSIVIGGTITVEVSYTIGEIIFTQEKQIVVTKVAPSTLKFNVGSEKLLYPTSSDDAIRAAITAVVVMNDGSTINPKEYIFRPYTLVVGSNTLTADYTFNGVTVVGVVVLNVIDVTLGSLNVTKNADFPTNIYTSSTLNNLKKYLSVRGVGIDGKTDLGVITEYTLSLADGTTWTAGNISFFVTSSGIDSAIVEIELSNYELSSTSVLFKNDGSKIYSDYVFEDSKSDFLSRLSVVGAWNDGLDHSSEHTFVIQSVSGADGASSIVVNYTVDGTEMSFEVALSLTTAEIVSIEVKLSDGYVVFTSGAPSDLENFAVLTMVYNSGRREVKSFGDIDSYGFTAKDWKTGGSVSVTLSTVFKDKQYKATFNVNVTTVRVSSITVVYTQKSAVYTSATMAQIMSAGLITVFAKYNDGTENYITKDISDLNLSASLVVGNSVVTVTYFNGIDNIVSTFNVDTTAVFATGISVTFDSSARILTTTNNAILAPYLTVNLLFNDGSKQKLEYIDGYTLNGDISSPGKKTMTVVYVKDSLSYDMTFEVEVQIAVLEGISVSFDQKEKEFYISGGLDAMKKGGYLNVVARFEDKSSVTLGQDEYSLTIGGSLVVGNNTVTVEYTINSVTKRDIFVVNITAAKVIGIKAKFDIGDGKIFTSTALDSLNDGRLSVTAIWNDGVNHDTTIEEIVLTASDWTPGRRTITVSVMVEGAEFSATFDVEVTEVKIASLTLNWLDSMPTVYTSTTLGLLKNYLEVFGVYNDGVTPNIKLDPEQYSLNGVLSVGVSNINVVYASDASASGNIDVDVSEVKISAISATYSDSKGTIFTSTDFDAWKISNATRATVEYNDGTKKDILFDDYTLAGSFVAGKCTIIVEYTGSDPCVDDSVIKSTFDVNVTAVAIASTDAVFDGGVDVYSDSDIEDSVLKALIIEKLRFESVVFNDGKVHSFALSEVVLTLDKTTSGVWNITANYKLSGSDFVEYDSSFDFSIKIKYRISYSLDDGINNEQNPTTFVLDATGAILGDATRVGYNFDGWYLEEGFVNKVTLIDTSVAKDITLYAKFVAVGYNIVFNKNADDATGDMTSQNAEYDNEVALNLNDFERVGYTFVGWSLSSTDGAEYDYGNQARVINLVTEDNGTITLYAVWKLNVASSVTITDDFVDEYDTDKTHTITAEFTHDVDGLTCQYRWYFNEALIEAGTTNTIVLRNVSDSGKYTVEVVLYNGAQYASKSSEIKTYTINAKEFTESMVGAVEGVFVYDNDEKEPIVTVVDVKVLNNTEYSITYLNNKNAGTATLYVTGTGNYKGQIIRYFNIAKANYDMTGISFTDKKVVENGKGQSLLISGILPEGVVAEYLGNNEINPGNYTITVRFTGGTNYNAIDDMQAKLTINRKQVDSGEGNVIIEGNDDGIRPDCTLVAKDITKEIKEIKQKKGKFLLAYEVSLMENNVVVKPSGMLTVRLKISDDMKERKGLNIFRVSADGNHVLVESTRDGDYLVFETETLEKFAVIQVKQVNKLAIELSVGGVVVFGIVVTCIVVVYMTKKKKAKAN